MVKYLSDGERQTFMERLNQINDWMIERVMTGTHQGGEFAVAMTTVNSYICHINEYGIRFDRLKNRVRDDLAEFYVMGGPLADCPTQL